MVQKKIDYVLAYPQASIEKEIYMRIPKRFKVVDAGTKYYVLNFHRNIYKQKQAGRVGNHYLTKMLIQKFGFKKLSIDDCVFY